MIMFGTRAQNSDCSDLKVSEKEKITEHVSSYT